jgi:RHS repeat-associated protein
LILAHDGPTGLYFLRARYYSPTLHRFLSEDPIGFAGGDTNLYAYVSNNPTNFIDATGLVRWTGSQSGVEFLTAGAVKFDLQSECVNGNRVRATVLAVGPGASIGVEFSATHESVEFVDNLSLPDPSALSGVFLYAGGGFSLPPSAAMRVGIILGGGDPNGPHGVSASAIQLGRARSLGAGFVRGFAANIGFLVGSSTVLNSEVEPCKKK